MDTSTTFHGLFQGDHDDTEGDAVIVAVFSSEERAEDFAEMLSKQHTELKRVQNDLKNQRLPFEEVPDLYWDVSPIAFDPRSEEEL